MVLNYIWIAFFLIAFIVAVVKLIFFADFTVFPAIMQSTFDTSKQGFEISLGLTGVLSLWLGIMKVGEKVKVVIPQELAYGARHAGDKIEPLSTLVFEIELLDIIAPAAADSTSAH